MCRLSCSQHKNLSVYAVSQYDPTRTLSLRNVFARDIKKRFAKLRGIVRRALIDQDVLGLQPTNFAEMTLPGRRAFDFPRSGDKVAGFMEWLKQQEQAGILEVLGRPQLGQAVELAWTNKYVETAYNRGVQRARQEMISHGYNVPTIEATGGINAVVNTPIHADRLGLLYTRVYGDLRGITDSMDLQISRVLSQAMASGENPRRIATLLTKTISGPVGDLGLTDTLGRFIPAQRRAEMLARTEIIRAHAEGQLQEFKNWGMEGVRVKAELVTAGDSRVCSECQSLEGRIFNIDEASGIIPVHPSCRCAFLPIEVEGNA